MMKIWKITTMPYVGFMFFMPAAKNKKAAQATRPSAGSPMPLGKS